MWFDVDVSDFQIKPTVDILAFLATFFQKLGEILINFVVTLLSLLIILYVLCSIRVLYLLSHHRYPHTTFISNCVDVIKLNSLFVLHF